MIDELAIARTRSAGCSRGLTADQERARRGEHLRPCLLSRSFAKQSRWRTVVEFRIESLEPRLRDPATIALVQQERHLQGNTAALLDVAFRRPGPLGPLADRSCFGDATDIGR